MYFYLLAQFPDDNTFQVDWFGNEIGFSPFRWYAQTAANSEYLGRIIGNFIIEIKSTYPALSYSQFHCIGKYNLNTL